MHEWLVLLKCGHFFCAAVKACDMDHKKRNKVYSFPSHTRCGGWVKVCYLPTPPNKQIAQHYLCNGTTVPIGAVLHCPNDAGLQTPIWMPRYMQTSQVCGYLFTLEETVIHLLCPPFKQILQNAVHCNALSKQHHQGSEAPPFRCNLFSLLSRYQVGQQEE